jgi:hypothetical protein
MNSRKTTAETESSRSNRTVLHPSKNSAVDLAGEGWGTPGSAYVQYYPPMRDFSPILVFGLLIHLYLHLYGQLCDNCPTLCEYVLQSHSRLISMYGKHFESMYEGSMVGAGVTVFAVWGYVIAKMQPDRVVGFQVSLNPKLLASVLGGDEKEIQKAIAYLCAPDPLSRNKAEEGRRLVRLGQFDYQVVSGKLYSDIRDEEAKRAYNRERQAKRRQMLKNGKPLTGEGLVEKARRDGMPEGEVDKISDACLPDEH